MLQENEDRILVRVGKRKFPSSQKENQEKSVIYKRRGLFSHGESLSDEFSAEAGILSYCSPTMVVDGIGAEIPQVGGLGIIHDEDHKVTATSKPPMGNSLGEERIPKNSKFTPVKKHVVSTVVGTKGGGVNPGCVVATPSGNRYMFKPMAQEKNSWSVWETIHEVAAGNLFRLYLGKSKAPPIGICSEILPGGSERFGVSSAMFTRFTQLASTAWRANKPQDFEKIIVTSTFLGDPDPHAKNMGYNQDGEICKLDHGRAFLVEFRSGLEFLRYMIKVCEYNRYGYTLSLNAIKEQLQFIKSQGLDVAREMIKDAFGGLHQYCGNLFPLRLEAHNPLRWVDPEMKKGKKKYMPVGYIPIRSWGNYEECTTTIISNNFLAIDGALEILTGMEEQGYKGIKIQLEGNPPISAEGADVKVCVDFNGKYSESMRTDVMGKAYSRW